MLLSFTNVCVFQINKHIMVIFRNMYYLVKRNSNVPSSLAAKPPGDDLGQHTGGDKAGIPVPVIAAGVGGLVLLTVVIVVVVVLQRRR